VVAAGTAASAVLIEPLPAGATKGVILARGAVVNTAKLILNASSTGAQQTATLANLAAAGVVPRAVL
jgi:hypothetical protein